MTMNAGAELIELSLFEDRRRARTTEGSAEILIFTGVRYERIADEPAASRPRAQEAR